MNRTLHICVQLVNPILRIIHAFVQIIDRTWLSIYLYSLLIAYDREYICTACRLHRTVHIFIQLVDRTRPHIYPVRLTGHTNIRRTYLLYLDMPDSNQAMHQHSFKCPLKFILQKNYYHSCVCNLNYIKINKKIKKSVYLKVANVIID